MANFIPNYKPNEKLLSNLGKINSKKTLEKELRRLITLAKRREKQIKKNKLSSYSLEQLVARNEKIRDQAGVYGNTFTISQRFEEQHLRDLIRSFHRFLSSETATVQGIRNIAEQHRRDFEKMAGKQLGESDLSRLYSILENTNMKKLYEIIPSEEVIEVIFSSNNSPEQFGKNIEMLINNDIVFDVNDLNQIKKILGMSEEDIKKYVNNYEDVMQ